MISKVNSFLIKNKLSATVIFLTFILFLGFFLRHYNYLSYPRHGATFDEFAWTWLGINLIKEKTPISWSPHPIYKEIKEIRYQGAAFLLVKPYLEHPPFFGIIAGSFAIIRGAEDMYDATLHRVRPLALMLGVFSILMLFLLVEDLYGRRIALVSSFLYATVPTIVIGSRILQNENFLIPFWLLSIYLINKYLKSGRKRFRNLAAAVAGLLSLAKVPWLVVGLSLSMVLSYKNKWKDAFIVMAITLCLFSIFLIYGVYYDKELFTALWKLQLARYDISFSGFFGVFRDPLLVDRFYIDGWIYFGWFSIFAVSKEFRKHFLILIPFVAYLILYIFAIPNEPAHGWYRFPFYPFLLIATALVLKEELKKTTLVSLLFVFIVGLSLLANTWQVAFGFSYLVYRIFIIVGALSVLLPLWWKKNFKFQALYIWIPLFILLNIWSVLSYIE